MAVATYIGDLLPEAIFTSCAKFDAHTHYHCQAINNNRYFLGLLTVSMATIVIDPTQVQRS